MRKKTGILKQRILLASGSPRRKELLEAMGLDVRVHSTDVSEDFPQDMDLEQVAGFLATKKAHAAVSYRLKGEIILAGDSVVIYDDQMLEKPTTREGAIKMLQILSGNKHQVMTGICLLSDMVEKVFTDVSQVFFEPLDQTEIEYYIDNYQPYDKAGSYGIQEWIGWCKVKRIEGSYTNIMGLPTALIYEYLQKYF